MDRPEWLPARSWQLVERSVAALREALGERLAAAVLVGTAANPAHQHRARAPEILAVVGDGALDAAALARGLRGPMGDGARVRLVSRRELARSCDVFALEVAEWKARSLLLFGDDPFAALEVRPADLRHGLETELRGLGRRIKNRVLTGLATGEKRDDPRQAVIDGVDRLVVVAHHALLLLGADPPHDEPALVRALAERAKADAEPLLAELARVRAGERIDPAQALEALLAVVEPATTLVDELTVPA